MPTCGSRMRICLVYDCLFPHTVGGAERWYRNLGERLAAEGHEVTYLTLRQWDRGVDPGVPGVRVLAVGPRMALYAGGRRRILPPVVFGLGVLWHLLRRGRRYDVVHTASFPYFSLPMAGALRGSAGTGSSWTGTRCGRGATGSSTWAPGPASSAPRSSGCASTSPACFCFSRLHAERLKAAGLRGEVTVLEGEYTATVPSPSSPRPAEPWWCSPGATSRRSARRLWSEPSWTPLSASRGCAGHLRRRTGAHRRPAGDRGRGGAGHGVGPGLRRRRGGGHGAGDGPVHAPPLAPGGLRPDRRRGGLTGRPQHRRRRRRQRGDRAHRRGRERDGGVLGERGRAG